MTETPMVERSQRRWDCNTCVQNSQEYPTLGLRGCTGQPMAHFHIGKKKELVCPNGARFHIFDQGRRHARKLQGLIALLLIQGRVEESLKSTLTEFERERIAKLAEDQTPQEYLDFLADNLAGWRFIVSRPFLEGAKAAIEQMGEAIQPRASADLTKLIDVSEADMEKADLDWQNESNKAKRFSARRSRWGAAKRAFVFLVGEPNKKDGAPSLVDRIRDAAGLDETDFRRKFVVRQFMTTFSISRDEAEKLANEEFLGGLESALEEKTTSSEEDAKPEPDEETPSKAEGPTSQTELPSMVIKGTKSPASKKKAMAFFEEHGGFPDLSVRAAVNGTRPKSVKLSGCETDPEAAEAAMRTAVKEE